MDGEFWLGMSEFGEGFVDVSRHGCVDVAVIIIPVQVDADVEAAVPVGGDPRSATPGPGAGTPLFSAFVLHTPKSSTRQGRR